MLRVSGWSPGTAGLGRRSGVHLLNGRKAEFGGRLRQAGCRTASDLLGGRTSHGYAPRCKCFLTNYYAESRLRPSTRARSLFLVYSLVCLDMEERL